MLNANSKINGKDKNLKFGGLFPSFACLLWKDLGISVPYVPPGRGMKMAPGRIASCPWPLSCGGADPEAALYWKPHKSRCILQLNKLREPLSAAPASPTSQFHAQQQLGRLQKFLSGSSRECLWSPPSFCAHAKPKGRRDRYRGNVCGARSCSELPQG